MVNFQIQKQQCFSFIRTETITIKIRQTSIDLILIVFFLLITTFDLIFSHKFNMNSSLELSYNTDTTKLVIPEYGRNIQKMVRHAIKIENNEERNKAAKVIIKVMDLINPNTRNSNSEEHAQKLWAHLHIISTSNLM